MPAPAKGLPEVIPTALPALLEADELLPAELLPPPVAALELEEAAEELLDELGGTTTGTELDADEATALDEALLDDEALPGALDAAEDETLEAEDEALLDEALEAVLEELADDEALLDDEALEAEEEALLDEDEPAAVRSAQKPTEVMLLLAAIDLFQDIADSATLLPFCDQLAFQSWLILPLGSSKLPFQSFTALLPVLLTVTWPQKPVPQSLLSV